MLFRTLYVLGFLTFGLCAAENLHLPFPTCKRDVPKRDYAICLKNAINQSWQVLVKGLPAEFDFPPLDPYFHKYQEGEFDSGEIHGKISITNTTIYGMRAMRIKAVRPHFTNDTYRLELNLNIPRIDFDGICKASGTLGGFRMGGITYCNATVEDLRQVWDISGIVKDDKWIIEHFRLSPVIKSLKIFLDDLFEGNQEINNLAMMFVNEYWPQLYRVTLPIAAEGWDTIFSDLVTRLFAKLSFSEVFP